MQESYRVAASVMVFRPAMEGAGSPYEILLLHKPRKRDAWQLPQGGAEGQETPEQTALRELSEEASLNDVQLLGTSTEVYQYDFPASFRRFRPDHIRGQRIAYVFALAGRDAVVSVDQREVDRFLWVVPEALATYIHRKEYLALLRRLVDEGKMLLGERK